MTPEKFFDYLEGKLPPAERERLERALISDPELQQQFVAARQIHRSLERPPDESAATTRAGSRGRQLAAAFAVLVAMNVALGLFYIFRSNQPSAEVRKARQEKIYQEVHGSVEKAATAVLHPTHARPGADCHRRSAGKAGRGGPIDSRSRDPGRRLRREGFA